MKPIQTWFDEYAESHQNPTNKLFHWLCIPLIVFSLLGLLASIPSEFLQSFFPGLIRPYIHFGSILLLGSLIFYARLSIPMAIGRLVFSFLCLQGIIWIGNLEYPLWLISLIIFVIAWIGQFIGHQIEGKKPSFIKDLQFLMIGPAWLLGFIYKKLGISY